MTKLPKKKKERESVSEPVEGFSPGWGMRSFAMSQGGEFCSPILFFFPVVIMEDLNLWHL